MPRASGERSEVAAARLGRSAPAIALALVLAAAPVASSFVFSHRVGLNLSDEGYLWVGAREVARGKVPLRDVQSYDPGRYYWTAAWFRLLGDDGLSALRAASAAFYACGLTLGLLALRRLGGSWWVAALVASPLLALWAYPRHKLFEPALALAAVWLAVRLVERPTLRRHVEAGLGTGLAICFGKNHGLYWLVAFALWIPWTSFRAETHPAGQLRARFAAFGGGLLLGTLPLLALALLAPGFAGAMVRDIADILGRGTNLRLPIPWPWSPVPVASALDAWSRVGTASGFLLLAAALPSAALALGWGLRRRVGLPACVPLAAACVGIPYAHHAFDRADLPHLAQAIAPWILAAVALPWALRPGWARRFAGLGLVVVIGISAAALIPVQPALRWRLEPDQWQSVRLGGEELLLPRETASLLQALVTSLGDTLPEASVVAILPDLPGLYPLLGLRPPMRTLYPRILPESEPRQRELELAIRRAGVEWVVLGDPKPDGRPDLRFRNTHPLLWRALQRDFHPVPVDGLPPHYEVRARDRRP